MGFRSVAVSVSLSLLLLGTGLGCDKDKSEEQKKTTVVFDSPGSPWDSGATAPSLSKNAALPTAAKVKLIVLADKRCTERPCDPGPALRKVTGSLPGLEVVRHDWSEDECKKVFDREGLKVLPALLFEETIKKHPGYSTISPFLEATPKGKLHQLQIRTDFDPRAEICDNGKDDTGNDLVDCKDPGCKGHVACREEIPGRLDVFVMSQCPYGVKALDSMSDVLDAFDRKIDFRVHFIATAKGKGFKSLHGQPEVDENIRELCAIEHFGKSYAYMEYIWCRNRKIRDTNWKACTGKKGIDAGVLDKCFSGKEGQDLLGEDIKLAIELGVRASPTWLANNRHIFHGVAPEAIKQGFCKHNKGTKGCEKKLSSKSPLPDGVCN
ncbi:MAG: hypothetical protein DRI90_25750 [Deltaproteobacteria bacterium]|nr:MAG: hypothetical protein DRI90_25750 [Deltaproteobacteria bacterium]